MTEYNCPICYIKTCSFTTACNHEFCDECIITWISNNEEPTCPICRHSFSLKEKKDIIFRKRATRSDTFSYRKKHTTNTLKEMLNDFTMISNIEEQRKEAKKICKYMYNSIHYYKNDKSIITSFLEKITELEEDGIKECSIILFKLKERNIFKLY